MSRHGERLDLPAALPAGGRREASCPSTGERYRLEGAALSLLDGV
jgi:UDP-2-acetamido-3-amino-2,3-dideoxy-glucuronate N-acetyltransferase